MGTNPFKFGAKATWATSGAEWAGLAKQAEDLGYYSFQIDDHFNKAFAPVPAIMAAACATERVLVGPHVAGVDFRNVVEFAKEAATIDLLSGGRFTMGIGAGWNAVDYANAGIHQDNAITRIERLAEAVDIMRGLWGGEKFGYTGKHHTIAEHDAQPKPISSIPVLIGGGGQKILTMAAQKANIVGVNPKIVGRSINPKSMATAAAEAVDEKVGWIREAAAAAGTSDKIELQLQFFATVVTDDKMGVCEKFAPAFGLPVEVVANAPFFAIGTLAEIKDNILMMRERWGISYFCCQNDGTKQLAPIVAELAGK
jgi:probable F420-dependent oxidoreductase